MWVCKFCSTKGNETQNKKFIKGLGLINVFTDKLNNYHIGWNKVKTNNFWEKNLVTNIFLITHM